MTIIEQLRIARRALGMKQSELGKKLGLPQSHISKIEQDATDPRLSTVTDMARVLDLELMLIPRQFRPQVTFLLNGEKKQERMWMPNEGIDES